MYCMYCIVCMYRKWLTAYKLLDNKYLGQRNNHLPYKVPT